MKKSREATEGKPPLELVEEAFTVVRTAPAGVLASYFAGTLPFLLGLLYFCGDMSRSAFAEERLATASFAMMGLFFWMKTWHAIFARQLRCAIAGEPRLGISAGKVLAVCILQGCVQSTGLFLLPVALVILLPFGWLYAFYQNATALAFKEPLFLKDLAKQSWKQACVWPLQNHYILFLVKGFGLFVCLNVISAFLAIPFLLKTIFGVETRFMQMMGDPNTFVSVFFNTTFLTVIVCVTYLCVDPVLKALYVLRCCYGESLLTGEDLKVELRQLAEEGGAGAPAYRKAGGFAAAAALVFVLLALVPNASAQRSDAVERVASAVSVNPAELDRSIDEVMKGREYVWRLPREKAAKSKEKGIIAAFIEGVIESIFDGVKNVLRWIGKALEWLFKNRFNMGGGSGSGFSMVKFLLYLLAGALVLLIGWLIVQLWKRHRSQPQEILAQALPAVPDVADENVSEDQLPEDGWVKLARELFERGEFRLALRAYYLATLAHLAHRKLLTLAKFKSNRDYETELGRRGHAMPELYQTFRENVSVFDRIWYGLHEVNRDLVQHFAGNVQKINAT